MLHCSLCTLCAQCAMALYIYMEMYILPNIRPIKFMSAQERNLVIWLSSLFSIGLCICIFLFIGMISTASYGYDIRFLKRYFRCIRFHFNQFVAAHS